MSGVIQRTVSVGAGASDANLISGSVFEFARVNQFVSVGVLESADGAFITINAGPNVVLEESEPAVGTDYPIIPDEMYYNAVLAQGDRLVIGARNPTGGAIEMRVVVQATDL
ncbi:MAG: hypothetical protein GY769_23605 [bacterium]|nr:hypothetical protein [bacterium]